MEQVDGRVRMYVDGRLVLKTSLPPGPPISAIGSVMCVYVIVRVCSTHVLYKRHDSFPI